MSTPTGQPKSSTASLLIKSVGRKSPALLFNTNEATLGQGAHSPAHIPALRCDDRLSTRGKSLCFFTSVLTHFPETSKHVFLKELILHRMKHLASGQYLINLHRVNMENQIPSKA